MGRLRKMSKEEWEAFKAERDFLRMQRVHRARMPRVMGKGRTKEMNRLYKAEKEGRLYLTGETRRVGIARRTYGENDNRWSQIWGQENR